MKIKTHYDPPPIPDRNFDWSAVDDDSYDEGSPIGYGKTQMAAMADLLDQLLDRAEGSLAISSEEADQMAALLQSEDEK